jgi:2-polyprenyl-3-methyl-5-hydroxy-6-metoxy-1,4-benzoquinol methylase
LNRNITEDKKTQTMENKDALLFFKEMAATVKDPLAVKLSPTNDMTAYDAAFILKFADSNTSILDLGTGTGLTINKLYNHVKRITAVEPFESFTKYIVKSPSVQIVNKVIFEFSADTEYDLITVFGFISYFNEIEAKEVYRRCYTWVKPGGKIIIKNQFSIEQDVIIEG